MKNIKIVVSIVLVVLLGVGIWYLKRTPVKTIPSLVELLPGDTLLAVELIHLEETLKKIKANRLGRKLKETDIISVMQAMDVSAAELDHFNRVKTEIFSALDSPLFCDLFGRDAVIGFLPTIIRHEEDPKELLNSIVIVARTKFGAGVSKFINMIVADQMETQTYQYNEYEITGIMTEPGIIVYYVMCNARMLFTFNLETIKTCLKLEANPEESLAKNNNFQHLSGRLVRQDSTNFIFSNTKKLYECLVQNISITGKENPKETEAAIKGFNTLKGFDAVAFSSYDDGTNLMRDRVLVLFDKNRMAPAYQKMYNIGPEENKTLAMTPENSLFYYWDNSVCPSILKEFYINKMKSNGSTSDSIETEFQTGTGISLDEATSAFGNQVGFIVKDIQTGGPLPIPIFALLIQTKNRKSVEQIIASLIRKHQMVLAKDQAGDVLIQYLTLPLGEDLQPSYAFYKEFCIIATNRGLIKEMIHVDKIGGNITGAQAFKDIDKGLTENNNSLVFIRSKTMFEKIKVLAELGKNMSGMKNPGAKEKANAVLNKLVYPVLDGLQMYQTVSIRTHITDNEREVFIRSIIEE